MIFALVGVCIGLYLYGVLKFPCHCGIPTMLMLLVLMVLASQGLGVLMISALPNPRLGLSFASLWGVISFSICGMSFPAMAMYPVLHGLSYLFPLRYYYLLYVHCALDGFSLTAAAPWWVRWWCSPCCRYSLWDVSATSWSERPMYPKKSET